MAGAAAPPTLWTPGGLAAPHLPCWFLSEALHLGHGSGLHALGQRVKEHRLGSPGTWLVLHQMNLKQPEADSRRSQQISITPFLGGLDALGETRFV